MKKNKRSNETVGNIINSMSEFEMARWFALIDSVNIISKMCEEKNVSFDSVDIKPSAVEKYIEATCDIYTNKIYAEKEKTAANVVARLLPELKLVNVYGN